MQMLPVVITFFLSVFSNMKVRPRRRPLSLQWRCCLLAPQRRGKGHPSCGLLDYRRLPFPARWTPALPCCVPLLPNTLRTFLVGAAPAARRAAGRALRYRLRTCRLSPTPRL